MKPSNASLRVLKLASIYERKVAQLQKKAWFWALMAVMPIIDGTINYMLRGKDIIQDIKDINPVLKDYLSDYPEDYSKHKDEFDKFLSKSSKLEELFEKITSASDSEKANLIPDIEEFVKISYEIEELAPAISNYLDEMMTFAGKALDMSSSLLSLPTVYLKKSARIKIYIESLLNHLTMSRPVIQAQLAKIKKEMMNGQKSQTPKQDSTPTKSESIDVTPDLQSQIDQI